VAKRRPAEEERANATVVRGMDIIAAREERVVERYLGYQA